MERGVGVDGGAELIRARRRRMLAFLSFSAMRSSGSHDDAGLHALKKFVRRQHPAGAVENGRRQSQQRQRLHCGPQLLEPPLSGQQHRPAEVRSQGVQPGDVLVGERRVVVAPPELDRGDIPCRKFNERRGGVAQVQRTEEVGHQRILQELLDVFKDLEIPQKARVLQGRVLWHELALEHGVRTFVAVKRRVEPLRVTSVEPAIAREKGHAARLRAQLFANVIENELPSLRHDSRLVDAINENLVVHDRVPHFGNSSQPLNSCQAYRAFDDRP